MFKKIFPIFPCDDPDWFATFRDRNFRLEEKANGYVITKRGGRKVSVSADEFIQALETGLQSLYATAPTCMGATLRKRPQPIRTM
jgi:hypothetical protein